MPAEAQFNNPPSWFYDHISGSMMYFIIHLQTFIGSELWARNCDKPQEYRDRKQKEKKEKKQVPDLQELNLLQRWDGITSNKQINKHIQHSALQNYSWEEWRRRRGSQERILRPKSIWTVRHCTCRIWRDDKGCAWEGSRRKHSINRHPSQSLEALMHLAHCGGRGRGGT